MSADASRPRKVSVWAHPMVGVILALVLALVFAHPGWLIAVAGADMMDEARSP